MPLEGKPISARRDDHATEAVVGPMVIFRIRDISQFQGFPISFGLTSDSSDSPCGCKLLQGHNTTLAFLCLDDHSKRCLPGISTGDEDRGPVFRKHDQLLTPFLRLLFVASPKRKPCRDRTYASSSRLTVRCSPDSDGSDAGPWRHRHTVDRPESVRYQYSCQTPPDAATHTVAAAAAAAAASRE